MSKFMQLCYFPVFDMQEMRRHFIQFLDGFSDDALISSSISSGGYHDEPDGHYEVKLAAMEIREKLLALYDQLDLTSPMFDTVRFTGMAYSMAITGGPTDSDPPTVEAEILVEFDKLVPQPLWMQMLTWATEYERNKDGISQAEDHRA